MTTADRFNEQRVEQVLKSRQDLVSRSEWRSDRADLLGVARLARRELVHCRVLAWLLDPNGTHGLRQQVLANFLESVGASLPAFQPNTFQSVSLEEAHGATDESQARRVDLFVRGRKWEVIIEAKVDSGERPRQLARILELPLSWTE